VTLAWIVFALSLAIPFYVIVVYPALLALLSLRRRTVQSAAETEDTPTVTIILPVHNGESWIQRKLESIRALDYPADCLRVLVISDGSTDGTDEIVQCFPEVELVRIPFSGKAAALNAGLARATSNLLFFTDVRQPLDPSCLRHLVTCFEDPSVGVASGELDIRPGDSVEEASVGLYWRYEKWIRKRHSEIDSVLGASGCIYMMRRWLAAPLPPGTLNDDMHLPFQAFFRGYRLVFVEEARAYDDPTILRTEFRRKVRTQAGVYQLIGAFPALLGPRNRMWIHFLSHKVGRLLLPFALLSMLISSCFLSSPWAQIFVATQVLFYASALLDRVVPEGTPLKRVTSLVRTFVILMAAAMAASSILIRSSGAFWPKPTGAEQNA
jgi:cellulose synthase/poly-beta-1,6-N-acetylglucosamine synthase-like glycosyltransferase